MATSLKDSIQIVCNDTSACACKIEFKVTADQVTSAFDTAAKAAVKYAKIPGFRPGKAPVSIVRSRYKDYILEDVERNLQGAAFDKLSDSKDDQRDIVAFGALNAEKKPVSGEEYVFTMDVEIAPKFDLPDYKAFEVPAEKVASVDERVAQRLDYMKNLYSDYVAVEGPAQAGDMLRTSYESDFVLPEGASTSLTHAVKSDDSWLWLSEPEQIPGMLKALEGAEKGKEYSFTADFPADWRVAELQGKKVNYKVKVHEGQRKVALQDEAKLAEKMGEESVDKMMEDLKKDAEQELNNEVKEKAKEKVLEQLLAKTAEFQFPEGVRESTTQREFSHIAERLVRSEKDVEPFKADQEKHLEEAKKAAQEYLRKFFIIRAIARKENITVTEAEMDEQIKMMCAYMGYKEEDVRKALQRNGGSTELQADILMSKTLAFIADAIKK